MTKFLYYFLLSLLLLSKKDEVDARLLDSQSLAKNHFEIGDSLLNEIENLPEAYRRITENSFPTERKVRENKLKVNRQFINYEGMKKPFASFSSLNFQKYPVPQNNVGVFETSPDQGKCTNENDYMEKVFPKTATKLNNFKGTVWNWRKGRQVSHEVTGSKKTRRYLDYTNSQMPFNEGKPRFNVNHVPEKGRKSSIYGYSPVSALKPTERLVTKFVEIPGDSSILEYSRVRRYLDHKRAKKRARATLETKEAAMSGVLDPNLNLDGILEPHVRKRRVYRSKKRDLSFKTRKKESRSTHS